MTQSADAPIRLDVLPASPPPKRTSGKPPRFLNWELLAWGGLALFLVSVGVMTFHPYLMLQNSDGAVFTLLARSVVSGQGYMLPSLPVPQPYFAFTPCFPMQLAGLMALAQAVGIQPTSLSFLSLAKWYELVLFTGVLALFYQGVKPRLGWPLAFGLVLLLAVNGTVHQYLGDVLSDLPYLLVSLMALAALSRWHQEATVSHAVQGWGGLALLILTRPVGLALGLAHAGWSLLHRRWKPALVSLLVCVVSYGGWTAMEHQYRTTHATAGESVNRFLANSPVKLEVIKYFAVTKPEDEETLQVVKGPGQFTLDAVHRLEQYGRMISKQFFPTGEGVPKALKLVFFIASMALVGWGMLRTRSVASLAALYSLCYLAVLCAYPYVSARYLIPLLPFLLVFFFAGFHGVLTAIPRLSPRTIPMAMAAMALVVFQVQWEDAQAQWIRHAQVRFANTGPAVSAAQAGLFDTMQAVGPQGTVSLPQSSVIFTRKPELFYLYSGHRGERFPFYQNPEKLMQWMAQKQADYLQPSPSHPTYRAIYLMEDQAFKESRTLLGPLLQRYPERFELVYQAPQGTARLWRVK